MGLGHLQRSALLARGLSEHGKSKLLTPEGASERARELAPRADVASVLEIGGGMVDVDAAVEAVREDQPDVIVLDGPSAVQVAARISGGSALVLVIDDNGQAPIAADMIVNPNLHGDSLPYGELAPGAKVLAGSRFALVEGDSSRPRSTTEIPHRLLLTLGGSDPSGFTREVLSALDHPDFEALAITAVIGPFMDGPSIRQLDMSNVAVDYLEAPASLGEILSRSDLLICGAGQTLYQAARRGIPTVCVCVAPDQRAQMAAFLSANAVVDGGDGTRGNPDRIVQAVKLLCADASLRTRLSQVGRSLVDGLGAARVVSEILSEAGRRKTSTVR